MIGRASGQTPLSLPPRGDLTPLGQESNTCRDITDVIQPLTGVIYSPACASCCSVSGRMSIRQPVSRAARRAFWPSLPIASDSW